MRPLPYAYSYRKPRATEAVFVLNIAPLPYTEECGEFKFRCLCYVTLFSQLLHGKACCTAHFYITAALFSIQSHLEQARAKDVTLVIRRRDLHQVLALHQSPCYTADFDKP